ncbi:MAG: NADH-quinone oxidoreductase subunit L [Candidatus Saganbacteria bacterium]|nr:NADH-quinone oxidoreductase subunit L [Candidatus Saganbacteria bacterium]
MSSGALLLLLAVFVPVGGAFLLPLLGRWSASARNIMAFLLVLVSLACSTRLLLTVLTGQTAVYKFPFPLGMSFILSADGLAVFMAVVSALIGAIIVLFSFDYISHYENQNEYYFMVVLFLGSMTGLVYSQNLIFLYLFWELTAFASWRLIGFYRGRKDVLRADKAFLVTFFGALAMLIGFVFIYQQTGTFDLAAMKGLALPGLVVGLILCGILSKSATLPFQTWLPDAGVAPSPVTALLHAAVLVKIGVYVFARLFLMTFVLGAFWHTAVPVIAAASALIAAGAALIETDIKRVIAYSTVSQIGFIFLGLATGSLVGVVGGLLFILMHGLAKGGLFLSAGIIEQNARTKDITRMGGLFATMPVTAAAFAGCAFSIMGIPPFGGFFSKYFVIAGAVDSGQLWLALTFVLGAVLTIIYLFRLFNLIFLGPVKGIAAREGSRLMVFCVVLLAVLSLGAGALINYPAMAVRAAVAQMNGIVK